MNTHEHVVEVDDELLSALSFFAHDSDHIEIFSLHGAGSSTKERTAYLLEELGRRVRLNSCTFDFSGHGRSTGLLSELSLERRDRQSQYIIKKHNFAKPIIIGSSMGGDTALRMLKHFEPELIVLFCPAIYTKDAYTTPFTAEFTEVIRKPKSWENSELLQELKKYKGKLLVFIGDNDEVIPKGVIELIDKYSVNTSRKEIIFLSDCTHQMHAFIQEREGVRSAVVDKIVDFIES